MQKVRTCVQSPTKSSFGDVHDDHDLVHKAPWDDGCRHSIAKDSHKQEKEFVVTVEEDATEQGARQVSHGIRRHEGGSPFYGGGGNDLQVEEGRAELSDDPPL